MSETLVIAMIGGRRCAFRAVDAKSVIEAGKINPIPRAPDYIIGLTALRSQALTVLDCRIAIGCGTDDLLTDSRSIVVSHAGHSYALVVDQIVDISEDVAGTQPVPAGLGKQWTQVSSGMVETANGPALLLDVPALITRPRSDALAA